MKSKKVLAQLAALSLIFGAVGAGTAWADNEVILSGKIITAGEGLVTQDTTDATKYTMSDKTAHGLSMDGAATLTATGVNFVDAAHGNRTVAVDGGSTLSLTDGSVGVTDSFQSFFADGGSTITTEGTTITSGVWSNNSNVTLKDSTISGSMLYAGNGWSNGEADQKVADGLGEGTLTIDGGTANVKNVLVQNKGQFCVTNGAVLDVTGGTLANDEDIVKATGIENGGTITVRAKGSGSAYAEKSNNANINWWSYSTNFYAEKNATVKANKIFVEGTDGWRDWAYFSAKDSTIEAKTMEFRDFSSGDFKNSKVTADTVKIENSGPDMWVSFDGGSASLNSLIVDGKSYTCAYFTNAETTIQEKISIGEVGDVRVSGGTFHAGAVDVAGYLSFGDNVKAALGDVTVGSDGEETGSSMIDIWGSYYHGNPDVTISKLKLKGSATVYLNNGKLTTDDITADEGATIGIREDGILSTKSDQVYKNAASEAEKDSGDVKNKAFAFIGGTLELTDVKYTLAYAKAAKAALSKHTQGSETELRMTGKAYSEEGKELEKVSIDDASLIGNLENVTVSSDKNVLIGTEETLENPIIDEVKVEKQVADSLGAKNLELANAEGNVGVVITNDKKLTLGGAEGGSVITVVGEGGAEVDKNVKVIVGTTAPVVEGLAAAGTFTIGSAVDKKYTLKGEVVVNADSALNINGTTEITKSVTLAGGSAAVADGGKLITKELTVSKTGVLTGAAEVKDAHVESAILYIGSSDKAGELRVGKLSGGTIFLDPSWKDGKEIGDASGLAIEDVSKNVSTQLIAGHNSKISFGTKDLSDAEIIFAKTGETWGNSGILSAVYVAKNINLGETGALVADGTMTKYEAAADSGSVTFGEKSILMVNGAAVTDSAAISGVTESKVDSTSKLYIDGAEKGQTYHILEGAAATSKIAGWGDKNIISDSALLKFTGEVGPTTDAVQARATGIPYYDVTASAKTMKEAYGDEILTPNVYDEGLKGDGKVSDFAMKASKGSINGTTAAQVSAFNSASAVTELAGTAHGTYAVNNLFTDAVVDHMTLANERTHDKDVWAKYIHSEEDIGGLGLAGMGAGYDAQYNGIVVGADLYKGAKSTVGLALTYADGNISGNTLAAHTKNDAKYYGASVYGGIESGDSALLGDITYLHGKNDITQWNSTETITGSVKTDAFSIGIRGEEKIKAGEGQLVPYIGLRYMHLSNGSYTNSLGMAYDGDDLNLWLLPVGVKYSVDFKSKSWTVRPVAEVGYVWNMGDRDGRETVRLGNAHDSFGYDVADSGSYIARLAVEAEKDNTTFGIGYEYQKGDTVKANRWTASVNYRF